MEGLPNPGHEAPREDAATLMMLGDVISQQVVESRGFKHHDWPRSGRMAFIGLIYIGPCVTLWYRALDYLVHGTSKTAALKKMLLDQIICAPTLLGGFLTLMGVLSGLSSDQIASKFKKDYKDVLITNYYIWPAVQIANFYFVPLNHRLIVVQFVAIFWNSYLSWKTNQQ
uniref:protein Mpv17 n=1 Tax=Myxine glutinosa TaxID=7769 RepID=UPI00358E78BE